MFDLLSWDEEIIKEDVQQVFHRLVVFQNMLEQIRSQSQKIPYVSAFQEAVRMRQDFLNGLLNLHRPLSVSKIPSSLQDWIQLDRALQSATSWENTLKIWRRLKTQPGFEEAGMKRAYEEWMIQKNPDQDLGLPFEGGEETRLWELLDASKEWSHTLRIMKILQNRFAQRYGEGLKQRPILIQSLGALLARDQLPFEPGRVFWKFHFPFLAEQKTHIPWSDILKRLAFSPRWLTDAYLAFMKEGSGSHISWQETWDWMHRLKGGPYFEQAWQFFLQTPCDTTCDSKFQKALVFWEQQAHPSLLVWNLSDRHTENCLKIAGYLENLGRTMKKGEALYKSALLYLKCGNDTEHRNLVRKNLQETVNLGDSVKFSSLAQWSLDRM